MHGYETTVPVPLELMIMHGRAVVRGARRALVVVDMPFGSYEESPAVAFRNCAKVMKETDCGAVKIEGGRRMAETIRYLVDRGIPVMAHIGLTPQSVNVIGGFKAQGRQREEWAAIEADARAVADAGAFAVVLEAITEPLAQRITASIPIPTIGIGASLACDGQILVMEDMLGLSPRVPRFVKKFGKVGEAIEDAIRTLCRGRAHPRLPHPGAHLCDAGRRPAKERRAAERVGRNRRQGHEKVENPEQQGIGARAGRSRVGLTTDQSLAQGMPSAMYAASRGPAGPLIKKRAKVQGLKSAMAQQDDGLLREVEEELRRERLEKIWKQYGTYIIAGAAVIVLGVLGFKYWESHRIAAAQEAGARYEEALLLVNEKKDGSAEKEFEKIAVDGAGGYRALAQLQLAGSQSKQGKKAEALASLRGARQRRRPPISMLREFAHLQAAGLRVGEADFTEMENRLTPLMADEQPVAVQCA